MKKDISGIRTLFICFFMILPFGKSTAGLPYRYAKILNGLDDHHTMFTIAAKDPWGMIWLVSGGELYRYDGVNVLPFNKLFNQKLPFEDVQTISIDPWGRIWINGRNRIFIFDSYQWGFVNDKHITENIEHNHAISFCRHGDSFFVAMETGEVWQINKNEKSLLFNFDPSKGLKRRTIDRLFKADDRSIWLTLNGKLYHYDRKTKKRQQRAVPLSLFNYVEDILPLQGGLLLRSYKEGYFVYDGENFRWTALRSTKENDFTNWNHWAFEDTNSIKIFHKTGQYLEYSRDTSFRLLKKGYHRLDENVFSKKLNGWSRTGEEWLLSTDNGLYAVFPTSLNFEFMEIGSARGMTKQHGQYYFGGYGNLHHMNTQGVLSKTNQPSGKNFYAFLDIHPDTSYIALEGEFLARLIKNKIANVALKVPSQYIDRFSHMALCLSNYNASQILVGTANGIWKYNRLSGEISPLMDLQGNSIGEGTRIYSIKHESNQVTFTSEDGYFTFHEGKLQKRYPENDAKLLIHDHLSLNEKTYLATKGRGIVVLDAEKTRKFSVEEGLASNIVYHLKAVNESIFAGTHQGLSVIKANSIYNYHVVDGLPFEEFNHQAIYYDEHSQQLFMGGTGGYIAFKPNGLNTKADDVDISAPRLASFSIGLRENKFINNFATADLNHIDLPQETMMVTLNFSRPDNYRFGYRLLYKVEPYMDDFQEMPTSNQINLSGVKAGQYAVLVKLVSNRNAQTQTWSWRLEKEPFFYETQIFYLLILIGIATITSFFLYERDRRSQLEKQLRRQISSDLHDEVGGLLTGISMQADLLRYRPAGQQLQSIDAISKYSRDATQMMDDIVWAIDARNNYQGSLEDRIKFLAQQMLQPLGADVRFDVHSDYDRKIPQSIRQNTYLIVKEALHNICKHAKPTTVEITFKINSKSLYLEIQNNGVAEETAANSNRLGQGTQNMQRRAQQIKAEILIWRQQDRYVVKLTRHLYNGSWQKLLRRFKQPSHA